MTPFDQNQLSRFLGVDRGGPCHLFLPTFEGPASLDGTASVVGRVATAAKGSRFSYPGSTVADRDARAAACLAAVLGHTVKSGEIRWERADTFVPNHDGTAFLFGSRTNKGARWITGKEALGRFFRFEFGKRWSIRCVGQTFSIPAPDRLSREEYTAQTDYGVVARLLQPTSGNQVFLLAGLGGRATEGCARYLSEHLQELASRFENMSFAIILEFPPPVAPGNGTPVVAFDDKHPSGFLPVQ